MLKIPDKKKLTLFHLGNNVCLWYELGATFVLTEFANWWYAASYAFALITGILFLFIYYIMFVFRVGGNMFKRLRNFMVLVTFVYTANWFFVVLVTEKTNLHYILSILIVGFFVSLFTYHLNEYFVFYN